MYKLIRFFNQNRRGILIAVIIIALFLIGLQLLNNYVANNSQENISQNNNVNQSINTGNRNINVTSTNTSALGNSISPGTVRDDTEIITSFIENCNNGNLEEAYNMLTENCKEEMFSTLDDFRSFYYGNIFNESKVTFEIENWINNTYKVDIIPDMLATGKANNTVKQDYITIVNENGEDKLNVNNYIGRTSIEKSEEKDNVKITVNYKDVYMEYETYNMTIENNGQTIVVLDDLKGTESMYLEDQNEVRYNPYVHEITEDMMVVENGNTKTIDIKYYSRFSSTKNIRRMVFSRFNNGQYNSIEQNNISEFSINM